MNIRTPGKKPKKLTDDRAQMYSFRSEQRKPLLEWKMHLVAENTDRAGTGPVSLFDPVVQDVVEKLEVLPHDAVTIQENIKRLCPFSET